MEEREKAREKEKEKEKGERREQKGRELCSAVDESRWKEAERLIHDPSTDPNRPEAGFSRKTPLGACSWKNQPALVRLLLCRADVAVNLPNQFGCSPLADACIQGHTEIVRCLLCDPRVDPNLPDNCLRAPLRWALANGEAAAAALLLASPFLLDTRLVSLDEGKTPAQIARDREYHDLGRIVDRYEVDPEAVRLEVRRDLCLDGFPLLSFCSFSTCSWSTL